MKKNIFETLLKTETTIQDINDPEHTEPNRVLNAYTGNKGTEENYKSRTTKRGMRLKLEQGQWPYKAPRGYNNGKMNGKPGIYVSKEAVYISWIFADFSSGMWSVKELQRRCKRIGFKVSETALLRLLRNPIYYGMIHLPATETEPEQLIKGKHKAIITKTLFMKVQRVLKKQKHSTKLKQKP